MKTAFSEPTLVKRIYSFDFEKRVDHAVKSFYSGLEQLLDDDSYAESVIVDFTKKTNCKQWLN